jgi:hypothetical protein
MKWVANETTVSKTCQVVRILSIQKVEHQELQSKNIS